MNRTGKTDFAKRILLYTPTTTATTENAVNTVKLILFLLFDLFSFFKKNLNVRLLPLLQWTTNTIPHIPPLAAAAGAVTTYYKYK